MAATATIISADGVYSVAIQVSQDANGVNVVDVNITTTNEQSDVVVVRVNGDSAWSGPAQGG